MSEGIIKSGRKQSFTVLYKSAIEDKRLPLDARGLLAITLLHVHNTCFRWTFGNVRCHEDGNGNIKPLKNRSIGRIDPTVASIIVMAVWMIAKNQKHDLAEAVSQPGFSL